MQNNPQISVIVPAYNVEKYIGKCLDSIINQTYRNLEIIVVDDGSKDDTPVIIDGYEKKDSRLKIIHQENRGLSGARNSALKIASGTYIGYVDGDDSIEPDMYEKMLTACLENKAELAVCTYAQVDEEGRRLTSYDREENVYVLSREEALETYISDNKDYHIYNSVWSKLFRRDIVDGVEFPLGHNSEDIMYTVKALCGCSTCVFVDKPLYNYVQSRPDSIMNVSQKLADRRFNDELPFWEEQIEYFRRQGSEEIAEPDGDNRMPEILKDNKMDMSYMANLAAYYLTRRELFYYIDFRDRWMQDAAQRLADLIYQDREEILENYKNDFVSKGDRARIKLFLKSPGLYYRVNKWYEKIVVRIKNI